MNTISLNKIKLNLNFETQISPSGRPIRLSAISKNLQVPEKWINNTIKWHWIYTFRYLDKYDGFVSFEFDYLDNFLRKL
ncbi:MAG TPA: hypothetical protein PLS10_12370 [Chitinophagales bacterium]|nr:hypothetical protein [Chitinophagales bacterium]